MLLTGWTEVFIKVTDILNKPLPQLIDRPWLHCLEKYARFTVWDIDNPSRLAAEVCNVKCELPDPCC